MDTLPSWFLVRLSVFLPNESMSTHFHDRTKLTLARSSQSSPSLGEIHRAAEAVDLFDVARSDRIGAKAKSVARAKDFSGEHRPLACWSRRLAATDFLEGAPTSQSVRTLPKRSRRNGEHNLLLSLQSLFWRAAKTNRPAACAPRTLDALADEPAGDFACRRATEQQPSTVVLPLL
jgi:hypothetical protein